ncbi:MAG TPA: hypothetical protein DGT23_04060 [Micromonosporaceae bacterium]|nr:hypothetical protein [Micromonosporaceae bacterium]
METITPAGRAIRLAATLIAGLLLLGGTLWGSDDHFPFGPFRMYAGVNPPNEPAPDPRIEGTTVDGHVIQLGEKQTGLRRAEVEGQQGLFVADPSRLREVVEAYNRRNPQGPTLAEIRYVMRLHEIKTSRPTGKWSDSVLASWRVTS